MGRRQAVAIVALRLQPATPGGIDNAHDGDGEAVPLDFSAHHESPPKRPPEAQLIVGFRAPSKQPLWGGRLVAARH